MTQQFSLISSQELFNFTLYLLLCIKSLVFVVVISFATAFLPRPPTKVTLVSPGIPSTDHPWPEAYCFRSIPRSTCNPTSLKGYLFNFPGSIYDWSLVTTLTHTKRALKIIYLIPTNPGSWWVCRNSDTHDSDPCEKGLLNHPSLNPK